MQQFCLARADVSEVWYSGEAGRASIIVLVLLDEGLPAGHQQSEEVKER